MLMSLSGVIFNMEYDEQMSLCVLGTNIYAQGELSTM